MARRAVLVLCDSLRRDLITPEVAPTLSGIARDFADYVRARSVFPSTTRTASASIATGCWPVSHGLLGNTMALDEGEGLVCRNAGFPDFRDRMRRATGRTLHRPALAERLQGRGGAILVSNASPGAAHFQDPDAFGTLHHRSGSWARGGGPLAAGDTIVTEAGMAGDRLATRYFCDEVVRGSRPSLATLWLSEPDKTGHKVALGSPAHREAIAHADACVAEVLAAIAAEEARGEEFIAVFMADHGMETTVDTIPLTEMLVAEGLKAAPDSTEIVVAPNGSAGAIYASAEGRAKLDRVQAFIAAQPWCGRLIPQGELTEHGLPSDGRIGFAFAMRHDPARNQHGVSGLTDILEDPEKDTIYTGFGQHGGLGPNEQAPFLFVRSVAHRGRGAVDRPAGIVDAAPTILEFLTVSHEGCDGQPLR